MNDLFVALGLVLVLEGAMYALFPQAMINMIRRIPEMDVSSLRGMGIVVLAIGWLIVKLVRN